MSEPVKPAATERELALQREVEALRQEVVRLKEQNEALQIALETTAEHGDIIEDQLQNEILERERAELTLQSVLEVVSKKNTDLEIILQTTAEHGDMIENELRRANQAKTMFLSNMSHELRTPLNAIIGFAQLLSRDPHQSLEQRRNIETIVRSGEHLLNLISDILSLSKIEAGKLVLTSQAFDPRQMLKNLKEMMQGRARTKGIELTFEVSPSFPVLVVGDEGRLRQILLNLLSNAIKFTQSGRVMVRTSWMEGRGYFEVEDTGKGIAPGELDSLFIPFSQTQTGINLREGTGLGLAISRDLVELMGGEIQVRSQVGEGSTFWFEIDLPRSKEYQSAPLSMRVLRLVPDQPVPKILVVDDNADHRRLLSQLLESAGFDVFEARNGKEAITFWQTKRPQLLLMDIRMPKMNGDEATRTIRELEAQLNLPATPIVAISASVFEQDRALMAEAGANGFLPKPFRESEVFHKLAELLGVKYVMVDTSADFDDEEILIPERYQQLSEEWRLQFESAVTICDIAEVLALVEEIKPLDPELAVALGRAAIAVDFHILERLFTSDSV